MPIGAVELPNYPPLARLTERASEYLGENEGAYIRLRVKPVGRNPYTIGDQIRNGARDALVHELVSRLTGANTTDPVLVELMAPQGGRIMDMCEVPPLLEAVESIMQSRLNLAKVDGESQIMIAAFELIGRMVHSQMAERQAFFSRWLDSEDRRVAVQHDLLETQLMADWNMAEPEDPEVVKWREIGGALRDTMGAAIKPLSNIGTIIDARIRQQVEKQQGQAGQAGPAPVPPPAPPAPPAEPSSTAPPAEPSGTQIEATPDEIADATIELLEGLLSDAPELLTPERLAKLTPHHRKLKMALGVLEMIADKEGDLDPEPEPT